MFVMLLYYHKLIFTPLSYDTESDYTFFKDKRIHSLCFYGGGEGVNNGGGGGCILIILLTRGMALYYHKQMFTTLS